MLAPLLHKNMLAETRFLYVYKIVCIPRPNYYDVLKDPSHPQCFARIEWEIRHFLGHLKSGFFHSELKSGYIRANAASLGLHLLFWP